MTKLLGPVMHLFPKNRLTLTMTVEPIFSNLPITNMATIPVNPLPKNIKTYLFGRHPVEMAKKALFNKGTCLEENMKGLSVFKNMGKKIVTLFLATKCNRLFADFKCIADINVKRLTASYQRHKIYL